MPFGQIVLGPPGSGKTTYCAGLQHFFDILGRRSAVVNLDPANDALPYECDVDVRDLVSMEKVQEELGLGPNGGLLYCMEYLEANIDWLQEKLKPLEEKGCYFLFDCPGQVELFSIHKSMQRILDTMTKKWHYRLCAVQLVDAHLCSDPSKYMAALLLCLSTTLHIEQPQIYALSKFDLVEQYGELDFSPDFYLRAQGLDHLAETAERYLPEKFSKMTKDICDVIEDFGLVSFCPLAIEDKESILNVVRLADKANGFAYAAEAKIHAQMHSEKCDLQEEMGGLSFKDIPEEFRHGNSSLIGDPETLWERIQERSSICIKEREYEEGSHVTEHNS